MWKVWFWWHCRWNIWKSPEGMNETCSEHPHVFLIWKNKFFLGKFWEIISFSKNYQASHWWWVILRNVISVSLHILHLQEDNTTRRFPNTAFVKLFCQMFCIVCLTYAREILLEVMLAYLFTLHFKRPMQLSMFCLFQSWHAARTAIPSFF